MIYIYIIIIAVCILVLLKIILGVNVKKIKDLIKNKGLDDLVSTFPSNIDVVKGILKMLKNENINIQEEKETKTCLYLINGNKIIIANISDTFTRIQTMAHECLHSIQNKKILWAQYIIANFYLLYFFIIILLTLFHIIKTPYVHIIILSILGIIQYVLKSMLEMDAMIKAKYLARDYLKEYKIGTEEEVDRLIKCYDELNYLGIPATNYYLIRNIIIKILIYSLILLIV